MKLHLCKCLDCTIAGASVMMSAAIGRRDLANMFAGEVHVVDEHDNVIGRIRDVIEAMAAGEVNQEGYETPWRSVAASAEGVN